MEYKKCPNCNGDLCFIDRTYENCGWCGEPMPIEFQLDFNFEPIQVQDETL